MAKQTGYTIYNIFFPKISCADLMLAVYLGLILLFDCRAAIMRFLSGMLKKNIACLQADIRQAQDILDWFLIGASSLFSLAVFLWTFVLIFSITAGIVYGVFTMAFSRKEPSRYEPRDNEWITRPYYFGCMALFGYVIYNELRAKALVPSGSAFEVFNYLILWLFMIKQVIAYLLLALYNEEEPWMRDFFNARLAVRRFNTPVLIVTLIAAPLLYYALRYHFYSRLYAVCLTLVYATIVFCALDASAAWISRMQKPAENPCVDYSALRHLPRNARKKQSGLRA